MASDTRAALLDAAESSLAAVGYAGTSIRDLTRSVGIKESSFYNHFASKQALLDAVIDRAERTLDAVAAGFDVSPRDPHLAAAFYDNISPELLSDLAFRYLDTWLHDHHVGTARRVLTLEQYRNPQAGQRLRALTVEQPLTFQTNLFAHLMRQGRFRQDDPEAVALAFWGPVTALLATAEDDEELARHRLKTHLRHFTAVYTTPPPA